METWTKACGLLLLFDFDPLPSWNLTQIAKLRFFSVAAWVLGSGWNKAIAAGSIQVDLGSGLVIKEGGSPHLLSTKGGGQIPKPIQNANLEAPDWNGRPVANTLDGVYVILSFAASRNPFVRTC